MVRKLALMLSFIFLISITASAQDRVELFGGYSYQRLGLSPARNLNGWEISGQYKFADWIGAVADIDAHYGSPHNFDSRNFAIMFGPQISFPSRISPFAHVLAGIGHTTSGSDTSFSTAIGGGIDTRLAPFFSYRIIQADEVFTHFFGSTQHSARISTGLIFRF
jgi:hypothetical protein